MELGATVCIPREPRCLACPVREWCATQGEVPRAQRSARQQKKQIWCALDCRNGNGNDDGNDKIRLVRRPKKASLMPGMWELPQSSKPPRPLTEVSPWRTFRHSITVTDYTVHVLKKTLSADSASPARGEWIALERIPQIPITGLTRKILKAGGII